MKFHSQVYRKRASIVTVTAAGLLTAVDMWSERSAGGRPALWPCSPQAWPLCTLADVTYWSRLSCSVTACYPPPPPLPPPPTPPPPPPPTPTPPPPPPCPRPPPLLLLLCRPKHTNSASGASSPVAAPPPPHSTPSISRLWGDVLTGPGSSALTNDWHHQAPIHSAPFCVDDGSTAFLETVNEQLEKGWRVRDSVCLWSLNYLIEYRGGNRSSTVTIVTTFTLTVCWLFLDPGLSLKLTYFLSCKDAVFMLWLGLGTNKGFGEGKENIMFWLNIPINVAAIMNRDDPTSHEKYPVL